MCCWRQAVALALAALAEHGAQAQQKIDPTYKIQVTVYHQVRVCNASSISSATSNYVMVGSG